MTAPASGFDWPALMRAGIQGLGLAPAQFWALTPAEFLLLAGDAPAAAPMGRAALEALAARFPDAPTTNKEAADARDG